MVVSFYETAPCSPIVSLKHSHSVCRSCLILPHGTVVSMRPRNLSPVDSDVGAVNFPLCPVNIGTSLSEIKLGFSFSSNALCSSQESLVYGSFGRNAIGRTRGQGGVGVPRIKIDVVGVCVRLPLWKETCLALNWQRSQSSAGKSRTF